VAVEAALNDVNGLTASSYFEAGNDGPPLVLLYAGDATSASWSWGASHWRLHHIYARIARFGVVLNPAAEYSRNFGAILIFSTHSGWTGWSATRTGWPRCPALLRCRLEQVTALALVR